LQPPFALASEKIQLNAHHLFWQPVMIICYMNDNLLLGRSLIFIPTTLFAKPSL
jgi:hypothetical protein